MHSCCGPSFAVPTHSPVAGAPCTHALLRAWQFRTRFARLTWLSADAARLLGGILGVGAGLLEVPVLVTQDHVARGLKAVAGPRQRRQPPGLAAPLWPCSAPRRADAWGTVPAVCHRRCGASQLRAGCQGEGQVPRGLEAPGVWRLPDGQGAGQPLVEGGAQGAEQLPGGRGASRTRGFHVRAELRWVWETDGCGRLGCLGGAGC
jgi:hypothetical protein